MVAAADDDTPWRWIDTPERLGALVEQLRGAGRFALDTESNSMHAYRERVCLLQISLPDGDDVLVDPLAVDVRPLAEVLADDAILKVMHGADYDILCFKREYGFGIEGLFDTMIAARVLGWSGYGLGAILAERHGFVANKRMQRFDWGQRPLPRHALDYARYDTHFLLALHDDQQAALREAGRLPMHEHACLRQTRVEPRPSKAARMGPWRIKGVRELPPQGRAILWALYELREAVAEQLDKPVFRVMGDEVLLELARDPPGDAAEARQRRGLHPVLRDGGARRLLAAIEAEPPRPPARERGMSKELNQRFEALKAWRKEEAEREGVEPDVLLGKETLVALAEADPRDEAALVACGALDEWELSRYGAALLRVLTG